MKTSVKKSKTFSQLLGRRDGQKVPEAEDVKLGNDAIKLQGTVLYADLAESTNLVDGYKAWFAAEIYKSYLHCASKIIRDEGWIIIKHLSELQSVKLGLQSGVKPALHC